MADYFTLASLVGAANLTDDEVAWITKEINIESEICECSDEERTAWAEKRGLDDPDAGFGFLLEIQEGGNLGKFMWLTHGESFEVNNACGFLQYWLCTMRPEDSIGFEYTHTCSKPRIGAYGGGAAYITKDNTEFISTHEWLSQQGNTP